MSKHDVMTVSVCIAVYSLSERYSQIRIDFNYGDMNASKEASEVKIKGK